MIFNQEDQAFLQSFAPTRTCKKLIKVLENIETFHADIRNVGDVDPKVRIDALKLYRETLIDKLKILGQDELQRPEGDEYM